MKFSPDDVEIKKLWAESELKRALVGEGIPDLFKNCKVQYGYNQQQQIYSVTVMLDNRPRIITLRVGKDFTELSLANKDGDILEMARQEEEKGATFYKKD